MKTTKFLAKFMMRLVFILLLVAGFMVVQNSGKLQQLGSINLYQWRLIFPVLLIAGFMGLSIAAAIKRYNQPDLNLLLIVNSVMLIIYGMAVFFQISRIIH
jgi:cation transport ATPase